MHIKMPTAAIGVALALCCTAASAQLTNQGMLDQVVEAFATRAAAWQTVVLNAATFLFWTLGTISLVWTFGFMALRKADIAEFFAEFIRFCLFFGFFLWLLRNGPAFANSIIHSMRLLGERASGLPSATPSDIVDIGFFLVAQALRNVSIFSPVESFVGLVLSCGILILLALVAVNMLLLLVSAWLLMYAGIFFLGFGGSRWTSDMAINFYKTVLGVAVQLMVMVLLVGVGNDLLSSFYAKMNSGALNYSELVVMLVFCVALLMLVNRVPPLVAGIVSGAGIGNAGGIGNFGVGVAPSVAGVATAAVATAGAMIAAGAVSAGGGASAVMGTFSQASRNAAAGPDGMSALIGAGSSGGAGAGAGAGGGGGGDAGTGDTPFAQAAGFGGSAAGSGSSNLGDKAAQAPAAGMREVAAGRSHQTTGASTVSAIQAQASSSPEHLHGPARPHAPASGDHRLVPGAADADPVSEVAAFAQRDPGRDSSTPV